MHDDESWAEDDERGGWCEHPAPASMAIVVSDDPREVDQWRAALADLGYDALPVSDAEHALEHLQSLGSVELLITDARLAATGGLDLILAARMVDRGLPIVAVTEGSHANLRGHSAVLRGADAVVHRPCTRWQFMDAVDAALGARGSEAADGSLQSATGEDEPSGPA